MTVLKHKAEVTEQILAGSPYLTRLLEHHPDFANRAFSEPPERLLQEICADLYREEDIVAHLRHKKAEAALLIAIADLSGVWDVVQVTHALTQFADACLNASINFLLQDAVTREKISLRDKNNPSHQCGYVVLAMGKHGAHELNYSSDIDLIILYDPETAPLAKNVEPSTFFVKLTRSLVTLLQDITSDGYVFRVDLRLRPDPRATQVAISMEAAAIYYENQGQNWERAAMIKARPVAGDIALGEEFLKRLTSYIWRKYLDYAAIADVQSLKRQIHAVKGHGEIAVQGHNLKLGRGGIREIEFFVQTQQLIAGGRNPKLRGQRTLEMLDALAEAKWIASETAEDLKSAYCFLRMLEHRVQMVDDQQSHIVPTNPEAFERYARFCGFENGEALSIKLRATLETVQGHYAALFEDAGALAGEGGSLVFTGGEDDPATLETLQRMGFSQASEISATIRGWHFGRYAATRTARARELLTELMPTLLKTLAQSGDADQAFIAFDNFLKGLPAGIQLFSMIKANPSLLDLVAQILGAAPRLAEQLSQQPRILEAVVAPDFFSAVLQVENITRELNEVIPDHTPRDEAMDRARVLGREQMFRVGVRVLSETISAEEAGQGYSLIAGALLQKLLAVTETEMRQSHDEVPQGQCAVIAMGKLGSREMTATSDLDLILVYDQAAGAEMSGGPKPISINQYYARLTQRFVAAITAPTAEGTLYEVDLRLRPSGSKGPVAVSLSSFVDYQKNSAWTWEKLALTRARVVAGHPALTQKINTTIHETLCTPRDAAQTRKDVADMRALMLREQKDAGLWDIKRVRGGLVEVEFIAQYLQLLHAPAQPEILNTNTHACLQQAQQTGALIEADAQVLLQAIGLYQRITQLLRLCLSSPYEPDKASKKLNEAVNRAALMPDGSATEALLIDTQNQVAAIFDRIIGRP
jgi:[glutamine synthetase] adenylyltransferase / [glutamine synthetase]-adenylyl-L-tyrosine phosphorylase